MRNMSFALTTAQMYARTKTVTRRLGWDNLKPGERVMACEKCQGLGKGGKVRRIGVIECVSNRKERLCDITEAEVGLEGFENMLPAQFVRMFVEHNGCHFDTSVNRIEFRFCGGDGCQCEACGWSGTDDMTDGRVCEQCCADEPDGDEHGQTCPACGLEVWWLPKCPKCGAACNWLYGKMPE